MATIETTALTSMASSLAAPTSRPGGKRNSSSSCSIASSLFGGGSKQQAATAAVPTSSSSSRKSSTKEKRWRQKEDERVEKLRLLVSYLRNGSSQQLLVKPVKLEADEIALAQRYKSLPTLCENCLKSMELQQPIMDPMPHHQHAVSATGSVSSCSIMNLSGVAATCDAGYQGSNFSSCSRTPEIGWNNQSISGCSSHKQLNTSQSSAGIVINVRRSSEQSECLASASDTDSHHNQQLTSGAESDQTGSTYSGSSGSTTNLQAPANVGVYGDLVASHSSTPGGLSSVTADLPTPLLASSATINGPSPDGNYDQPSSSSPSKMFYIGDCETRRDGCAWTNPPNLASWIDNEVNSLVHDLEVKSLLAKSEKSLKSSKRKWLPSTSSNRRSSSGAHST